ncbi:STAS domain-containing protein [Streptomyces sp. NPDC005548]|uniref:STAS domain-containing protein n=1 Tax=Streptomyces sp. NPDC005548 TaxID=3364724 RepID=UPI0036D0CFB2
MRKAAEQPARLSITQTDRGGVRLLTLSGQIDADTTDVLRRNLQTSAPAPSRTVLDLSAVTFMDSSAINVLVAARRDALGAGGWIRMAHLTTPVQRVVEIVGLDTIIPCYSTLAEALTA